MEEACFGAGCFWHVEEVFSKFQGVETQVGYMGGNEEKFPNPSYEDVCSNESGFAEAVHLEFDPTKTSYAKLLNTFFTIHDPTQYHKQGPDVGSQYRSVIFYYDERQKKEAEKVMKDFQKKTGKKIVTEIVKAGKFVRAEEHHQKYFKKHPLACRITNIFGE